MYDLALYSEGSFRIEEMFKMPANYLSEMTEALSKKKEKEKQAMDKARGITTRTL